jgi:hypothetical protein
MTSTVGSQHPPQGHSLGGRHALSPTHAPGGHDHTVMISDRGMAKAMEADMRRRFFVALVLTLPLAVISGHIPGLPMLVHGPLSSWIGHAESFARQTR